MRDIENDNEKYKLTESGEAYAVDLLGGQDVANVLGCFMHILKTQGDFFGTKITEEGEGIRTWLKLIAPARLMKHCKNWESLVVSCEKMLEEESDWFKSHPHSDYWEYRVDKESL